MLTIKATQQFCRMSTVRQSLKLLKIANNFTNIRRCVSLDISGIYPPITTPFGNTGAIYHDMLEKNLKKWNEIPFRGFVVQGSNGEYVYLSDEERVEIVRKVSEFAAKDKLIIAGSGCESTAATIKMTDEMAHAGANAALIVTPCYFKSGMNTKALIHHYTKVADHSEIPVILYSVPGNTGIDLPLEVSVELSHHDNIIGIKESGADIVKITELCHRTRKSSGGFQVLAGSASFLLPALLLGAKGGVCALANILGNDVCELMRLYQMNEMEKAKDLQYRLIAPNTAVTKLFGVPGVKTAMEWFGYYGGDPRPPLQPLDDADVQRLRSYFVDNNFLDS